MYELEACEIKTEAVVDEEEVSVYMYLRAH